MVASVPLVFEFSDFMGWLALRRHSGFNRTGVLYWLLYYLVLPQVRSNTQTYYCVLCTTPTVLVPGNIEIAEKRNTTVQL